MAQELDNAFGDQGCHWPTILPDEIVLSKGLPQVFEAVLEEVGEAAASLGTDQGPQ